jgi:PTH1 family peptidyl-tRNA hydrolase
MKIIVGLGNPGKEYEHSRHNAGWMVLDALHNELGAEPFKEEKKFKAQLAAASLNGEKLVLVKPLTFMNLSGEAVQPITAFYKVQPEDVFCIFDDLDTPFGTIRIRAKGGAGTHNGMKSMVQRLGEDFPRLRIGIESRGATSAKEHETTSFVLGKFNREETAIFKKMLKTSVDAVKTWITEGIDAAMNAYNS